MTPPLLLVDPPAEPFWPLSATRPVADLLAGTRTFRARWSAREGEPAAVLCAPEVRGCAFRSGQPPALGPLSAGPSSGEGAGLRVALSTWLPPEDWRFPPDPAATLSGGVPVAWRLDEAARSTAGDAATPEEAVAGLATLGLPAREAGGTLLRSAWDMMAANPELLRRDAGAFLPSEDVPVVDFVVLLGENLKAGADVTIGPFVVLDARAGPIVLDRGARIEPHTLCRGPLYVGRGSVILGGAVGGGTSIGPGCRIRGEVEQTIVQGWANKSHDGFVGHSVIGEWVNLGAGTITSDLKNTYGSVRVRGPGGRIDTGLLKLGALLGDHVRTGIGSLLTTGARIGPGSHVYGGGAVAPDYLPAFSWHDGRGQERVRLEPFLASVETAMGRRDQRPTAAERAMLTALHARAG